MNRSGVTIFVCVSCRRRLGDGEDAFDQPGLELVAALEQGLREAGVVFGPLPSPVPLIREREQGGAG